MNDSPLAEFWQRSPALDSWVQSVVHRPAEPGKFAPIPDWLPLSLRDRLAAMGIEQLFAHQARALEEARVGHDVGIVTGTSSGKTLCFALPVLDRLLAEPMARALVLYPTKALAHDQLDAFLRLTERTQMRIAHYDGDTPKSQRSAIRQSAQIVLSNPDMLHVGILPAHELWGKFLRALRVIVIDECHVYRGVFGSHVAWVLGRLLRLCEWYGSRPQIIAASATIADPDRAFRALTGREFRVIAGNDAPAGAKTLFFCGNPDPESDRTTNAKAADILANAAREDVRTMVFCRSRATTELVLKQTRKRLGDALSEKVDSYRGGYSPRERREIEQRLFKGELTGLVTTSAMELGVDVGALSTVVLNGLPGSTSSFWQQIGRAGRSGSEGAAIILARNDAREQFMIRRPEVMLSQSLDAATLAPLNQHIASRQLLCAAYERPISPEEFGPWLPAGQAIADSMVQAGELQFQAGRYFYPSHTAPAGQVNIRGTSDEILTLLAGSEVLGTAERWRAIETLHTGAVYLHRGTSYEVRELNLVQSVVRLIESEPPYTTQSIAQSVLETKIVIASEKAGDVDVHLAGLGVTTLVSGYKKMSLDGEAVLEVVPLELPPIHLDTVGVRLDLPQLVDPGDIAGIHALEHALAVVAPLLAGCDRGDLRTSWYAVDPSTLRPSVYIFDFCEGGIGLSERLFAEREKWFALALDLLLSCPCEEGCPLCLYMADCEHGNEALSKPAALALLKSLAQRPDLNLNG